MSAKSVILLNHTGIYLPYHTTSNGLAGVYPYEGKVVLLFGFVGVF